MHVRDGRLLFNSDSLKPILDLLAYVQGRNQLIETEWRIAGERNDARGGKMTLVVSPFPGSRHGLNSNKLMEEAGKTPVAVLQCGRF
jgi:hypothetical protein